MAEQAIFCPLRSKWSGLCLGLPGFWPLWFPPYHQFFIFDWALCSFGQLLGLLDESLWQEPTQEIYDCSLYLCSQSLSSWGESGDWWELWPLKRYTICLECSSMDKVPPCVRHTFTGSGSLWYLVQKTVEKEKSDEIYVLACLFIEWAIEKLPKIRYNR